MSSVLSYDAILNGLLAAGWPRTVAERRAREEAPATAPNNQRDARVLEKAEQHEVMKLFRAYGFVIYSLSQPRATKQSPGLPDLWCVHTRRPIAYWWETKRQVGGEHSPAQLEFRAHCLRCGVGYGTGDRYAAAEHLIALGLASRVGGTLEPVRNAPTTPTEG